MESKTLITEISRYFDIRELVSKAVYEAHGNEAWRFISPRLLQVLLVLRRDVLRVPLVCNNWKNGGALQQRGLRENTCEIVKKKTQAGALYLSAHTLGQAVDLSSPNMTADEMRDAITRHVDKLPYNVRIEGRTGAPTWLHIDVATAPNQATKIKWI